VAILHKVVHAEWSILMIKKQQIIDSKNKVISEGSRQFKIWDEDKGYLFEAKNHFVKSFSSRKLSEFITNKSDYANLHILAENIFKDTNMIAVKTKNIARPASIEEIGKVIGLCERRAKQFIERMMQKGLIAKSIINTEERIETHYYLNPLFFMSSKYLSPYLFMMFREQLKPYLKGWAWNTLNEAANLKDVDIKPVTESKPIVSPLIEKAREIIK
jgi:hypothetical protein